MIDIAFDYSGYTAEALGRLCDQRLACKGLYRRIYGAIEYYSFGRYYREETGYPHTLPLYVYSQHGAVYYVNIQPHETENDAEAILLWNADAQREYQKLSDKPCYLVTCPYISHRRRLGIAQAPEARGTLVFPAHSTKENETDYDIDKYIEEMLALPAEFHPIAVCLYVHDVRRGDHHHYLKKGLPVYSAGDMHDIYFGDRFYEMLRHFRYTMSNHVSSYAYYSVEMGIPFSFWGTRVKCNNLSNPNIPLGQYDFSGWPEFQLAERLFAGLHTAITPEQKEFVEFSLGVGVGISGEELGKIFWDAYRKRGRPVIDALTTARLRTKYAFNKLRYGISG